VKRAFLVPLGLAAAAAAAKTSSASPGVLTADPASGTSGVDAGRARLPREALLALARRSRGTSYAQAAATSLVATLSVGQEVPKPSVAGVGATGRFTATLSGRMLSWKLTFGHLSGPATITVLHSGTAGAVGPRFATVCSSCHSGAHGVLVLTQAQVAEMLAGKTYINLGTKANPAGEIRGQIRRIVSSSGGPPPAPPPPGGGHFSHVSHASHSSHSSHVSSS
jgi:hypothetical protein